MPLYHRLPYPLQVVAASAWGFRLRVERFDARTDALIAAAHEREGWPLDRWRSWQEQQLASLLERTASRVPFYKKYWAKREPRSWSDLRNWPILHKEQVRSDPTAFLVEGESPRQLHKVYTSGTTGTPLALWRRRRANIEWYALWEARVPRWSGLSRRRRSAVIGGQLVVPFDHPGPRFWVWNASMRSLYMSSYHLKPGNARAYVQALLDHSVEFVEAYPSSLYSLAMGILANHVPPPPVKLLVSNAEPVLAYQRDVIERAFQCPMRNTYGMAELAAAASECEEGAMHLWPEAGIVEVLDDESRQLPPGSTGRLVCTGLINDVMPLVRYDVGDRGALAVEAACSCGRSLPLLSEIEGRADDVVLTKDGRRVGRLDPVFKSGYAIREAQIVQEDRDTLRVRVVAEQGFDDNQASLLKTRLRERVGEMRIEIDSVQEIPRGPNGKFRAVVSKVTDSR